MVVFGKNGCSWAKVSYFGQKWLYSSNVVVIGQNGLYFGKSGCVRGKVDLFVQSGCIPSKVF